MTLLAFSEAEYVICARILLSLTIGDSDRLQMVPRCPKNCEHTSSPPSARTATVLCLVCASMSIPWRPTKTLLDSSITDPHSRVRSVQGAPQRVADLLDVDALQILPQPAQVHAQCAQCSTSDDACLCGFWSRLRMIRKTQQFARWKFASLCFNVYLPTA